MLIRTTYYYYYYYYDDYYYYYYYRTTTYNRNSNYNYIGIRNCDNLDFGQRLRYVRSNFGLRRSCDCASPPLASARV